MAIVGMSNRLCVCGVPTIEVNISLVVGATYSSGVIHKSEYQQRHKQQDGALTAAYWEILCFSEIQNLILLGVEISQE